MPWDNKTLATLKAMGGGSGGGGVSSWNDLTDKPFYETGKTVETDIVPSQTIVAESFPWGGYGGALNKMPNADLARGQEYVVTLNGAVYKSTAHYADSDICLGNPNLIDSGFEDTGEIFCCINYLQDGWMLYVTEAGEYSFDVKIIEEKTEIVPLDPKFLPDGYPRETVERVTLSNIENPYWSYNMATIGKGVKLVEGQTCYVSFGTGKVYEFVATRMDMGGIEGIVIGNPNPNAWDGDYSNEPEFPYNFPFSIALIPENELVAFKNSEIKNAFWHYSHIR